MSLAQSRKATVSYELRPMKCMKQFAALPYARRDGRVKVCLITSRETRRWIIPKGWPIKGLGPQEVAAREAFEEAGLNGQVGEDAIGTFKYVKRMEGARHVRCKVLVFPLLVTDQSKSWPEKGQRESKWIGPKKAASLVDEQDLAALLRSFEPT